MKSRRRSTSPSNGVEDDPIAGPLAHPTIQPGSPGHRILQVLVRQCQVCNGRSRQSFLPLGTLEAMKVHARCCVHWCLDMFGKLPDVVRRKVEVKSLKKAMRSWASNLHPMFEMSYALGGFVQNTSTRTKKIFGHCRHSFAKDPVKDECTRFMYCSKQLLGADMARHSLCVSAPLQSFDRARCTFS